MHARSRAGGRHPCWRHLQRAQGGVGQPGAIGGAQPVGAGSVHGARAARSSGPRARSVGSGVKIQSQLPPPHFLGDGAAREPPDPKLRRAPGAGGERASGRDCQPCDGRAGAATNGEHDCAAVTHPRAGFHSPGARTGSAADGVRRIVHRACVPVGAVHPVPPPPPSRPLPVLPSLRRTAFWRARQQRPAAGAPPSSGADGAGSRCRCRPRPTRDGSRPILWASTASRSTVRAVRGEGRGAGAHAAAQVTPA